MSELESTAIQGEEFWKGHILTAQTFMGSDVEYCRRNDLNPTTFSNYKMKFGFSKPKKRRTAFVQMKPKAVSDEATSVSIRASGAAQIQRGVPDPKWMAEFVSALFIKK